MSRKLPWPFIVVVITSFLLGAAWGWKLIQDRAAAAGQLVSEAKLRILSPAGFFPRELLLDFQRREKIEVELTVEHFPGSLLRRALKSAPGQYDIAIVYHYQVSAIRSERKMTNPYDSRLKFPVSISPDFRKLPDDRNLMDTAPLLWGLLGVAEPKTTPHTNGAFQLAAWPSLAIGSSDPSETPAAYASKLQSQISSPQIFSEMFEKSLELGPGGPASKVTKDSATQARLVSHASLEFGSLKDATKELEFRGLGEPPRYPLWILTAVTLVDGNLDRSRKFLRFLLEPNANIALVKHAKFGATTLRDSEDLGVLSKPLRSSYFRTFPLDQILVEKDERVRLTDEAFEQLVRGVDARTLVRATPTPRPPPKPVVAPANKPKSTALSNEGSGTDPEANAKIKASEAPMGEVSGTGTDSSSGHSAPTAATPANAVEETAP